MRSDVILSIQQFHWALFTKVLHDGTTCLYGGYAMDDNGKWIVCQHCRDKMRGSGPFGPDPSINSVVIWGLSQWCSRQSEAVLPRTGNWATQVANFFSSTSKRKLQRGKNRSKELWKRHPKRYFFWEAIGGWSPKGRQLVQAGEPGWEGAILLPRPD